MCDEHLQHISYLKRRIATLLNVLDEYFQARETGDINPNWIELRNEIIELKKELRGK